MFRVQQEIDFVLSLQRRAISGEVVPAAFQRPYVWTEAHVEALWASILMGLPIGAFLLWRPQEPANTARLLGPIEIQPSHRAALVLDGQNRLATLAWSATDPDAQIPADAAGRSLWRSGRRLVADTIKSTVRFAAPDETDPWLVSMHHIGHSLQPHLRIVWDGNEGHLPRVDWLQKVEDRLRSARVVVTTIEASEADARRAYLLISSAGVPMSTEDFDAAITGAANRG